MPRGNEIENYYNRSVHKLVKCHFLGSKEATNVKSIQTNLRTLLVQAPEKEVNPNEPLPIEFQLAPSRWQNFFVMEEPGADLKALIRRRRLHQPPLSPYSGYPMSASPFSFLPFLWSSITIQDG